MTNGGRHVLDFVVADLVQSLAKADDGGSQNSAEVDHLRCGTCSREGPLVEDGLGRRSLDQLEFLQEPRNIFCPHVKVVKSHVEGEEIEVDVQVFSCLEH